MKWFLVKRGMGEVKVNDDMTHVAKFLLGVVLPQINNNQKKYADICFASFAATELLYVSRLYFIGVVKIVTNKYLMTYLDTIVIEN